MSEQAEQRLAAVRSRLALDDAAALALTRVVNVGYITGFQGVFDAEDAHVAVITDRSATIVTDSRYVEAATQAAVGTEWKVRLAATELTAGVCDALGESAATRLALESSTSYARFQKYAAQFAGEVVSADGWVEALRQVKSAEEVGCIEAAQQLTDAAFEWLLGFLVPGMCEREIALELEFFLRRAGSDGVAFDPIVASGPNSALPHSKPGDRRLVRGDLVVLDFGARFGGYCADMTRTVVIGKASTRQRETYDAVLAANLAGIEAVRPGLPGCEIDAAARSIIEAAGFGENFGHGLGHGVGLEVHELPGLGKRSTEPVPLGSVVTIEPGVYVPGFGGARIEDLVVVEEAGARVLTRSTKELIEL